jgi:hypothetical protein
LIDESDISAFEAEGGVGSDDFIESKPSELTKNIIVGITEGIE